MDEAEPIRRVLDALDEGKIPYMLTGSFASNYYGEPRTTHDIDLVVQISPERAGQLETALGTDFVVSGAGDATRRGSTFNAIHVATSFKADFWPLRQERFDQSAFARRRPVKLFGRTVSIPTAEDLILQKLRWGKESASEIQRRDVVGILRAQEEKFDWEYLRRWAGELGVDDLLDQLRNEAAV